jgi:heat-inducible transcriptional repressor
VPKRDGAPIEEVELTGRQAAVLRAMITAYVGEAAPIGSGTVSHLLPIRLSSASIRSTLGELAALGLVEQPHTSAGRVPTEEGLRLFIDQLLDPGEVAEYDRRTIAFGVDAAEADSLAQVTSHLLSERTRLLGFMLAPRLDRVVLQHVSLVRLSSERLLAVLVSKEGTAYRRLIEDASGADQAELDHMAALLNERVAGHSLREVRRMLHREAGSLRREAGRLLDRALALGARALPEADEVEADLVIATRLALLDQPEFRDPLRVRDLLEAVEAKERLLEVLEQMLEADGVSVALGGEVDAPGLRRCALVVTPYGTDTSPMGVLGVIGPSRMDYGRVIPLVDYFSRVVTEKLSA